MIRIPRWTWPTLCALLVAGMVTIAFLPWWRTFIGTDLGVYWEVSRRLWTDGRLSLGGNAWDHKPLGIYVVLAPFHWLNTPAAEFLGLKIGALFIYAAAFAAPAWLIARAAGAHARPFLSACCIAAAATLGASLALYGPLDAAQNGILVVAAVSLEVCGLALLWLAYLCPNRHGTTLRGVLAGVCIGSAPFFRPTAVVAGFILLVLAAFAVWMMFRQRGLTRSLARGRAEGMTEAAMNPAIAGAAAAGMTVLGWIAATAALGTLPADLWRVLVVFNAEYGAYYRMQTPIAEYITQSPECLLVAAGGCMAVLWACVSFWLRGGAAAANTVDGGVGQLAWPDARGNSAHGLATQTGLPGRTGVPGLPGMAGLAGVATAVALSALAYVAISFALGLYARKIQSFYPYQFALPAIFAGGAALSLVAAHAPKRAAAFAFMLMSAAVYLTVNSLRLCLPVVGGNDIASNQSMATGRIVDAIVAFNVPDPVVRTLWVQGNRAPLYAQAARVGIAPYDWTTFDTAVYAASDAHFDAWITRFRHSPPAFIVSLNNARSVPWMDQTKVQSRSHAIDEILASRYRRLTVDLAGQNTWPYGYEFIVYSRNDLGTPPGQPQP
jgi:hypothetical protein